MTHTAACEFIQIDPEGRVLSRQRSVDSPAGCASDAWTTKTLDLLSKPIGARTHLSAGPVDDKTWEIEIREDWEFRPIDPAGLLYMFTTITRHEFREVS